MRELDFLVIGAQNAGTTALWQLLRDHPQLAFPADSETPFFTDDKAFGRGLDWYTSMLFAEADPAARWGTANAQYMTGAAVAPARGKPVEAVAQRIAQTLPRVKLIALLADPIKRAIAQHRLAVRRGSEQRPLAAALRQQLTIGALTAARRSPTETNGYIAWGEYGRILAAYLTVIPAERLMVVLSEDLNSDPGGVVARVAAFLGVDESWRARVPDQAHRVGEDGLRVRYGVGEDGLRVRYGAGEDGLRVPSHDAQTLTDTLTSALPQQLRGVVELAVTEWNANGVRGDDLIPAPLLDTLHRHFAADATRLQWLCRVPIPWAAPAESPPRAPAVAHPEVSIVILAHDSPSEVEALLSSIVVNTDGAYEIVLIDNGSGPAGRDALAALAATYGARLIPLTENMTFSVSNNLGAAASSGDEIVLINSDVVVTAGWLENMRTVLHSAPDIAAVGTRSNFAPGPQGGIWLDDSSPAGVQEFGRFFNHSDVTRWFEIDWLAGFAVLVRRTAFAAIGGFDETVPWFAGEDISLSRALQAKGWRTVCAGDTFLYHAGHHTFYATGVNRSATRFARRATEAPKGPLGVSRLVVDAQGQVFEVQNGVACHLETWHAALMIKAGRPLEPATPEELEKLPLGPPISLCRVRGTNEVFVLHGDYRRRVRGNYDRIRRLPALSMISPAQVAQIPEGPPVQVEDALPPVPEIRIWLPSNPATIDVERLAPVQAVVAEIAAALQRGEGYALIRLEVDEILVLNHGLWPAHYLDRARAGVRGGAWGAAGVLRRAILAADAVGVIEDRSRVVWTPLLERLLFHYDLYPRLLCSAQVGHRLRGLDPASGLSSGPSLLAPMLEGRRVAIVCPKGVRDLGDERHAAYRRACGFDVRLTVGLDDTQELDAAFGALATDRGAYDVVLTVGAVPSKALCVRLARELDVVALDMGWGGLGDIVHPRLDNGGNSLVRLRGEVETYLEAVQASTPPTAHEFEGKLVRSRDGGPIFYIERGLARKVTHPALLSLFDHEPVQVPRGVLITTPCGTPLCAVHEALTQPYVLLDGRKVLVHAGIPTIAVPDMALDPIPVDEREVTL